jgi:hypothetical protein
MAKAAIGRLLASPENPGVEIPLHRDGLFARADALLPGAKGCILQETKADPDERTPKFFPIQGRLR